MIETLCLVVYLGCYTDATHTNGLYALEMDVPSDALRIAAAYPEKTAIYQALSADGRWLYSCAAGGASAYRAQGVRLERTGSVDLGGTPCHVSLMPNGKQLNWADYSTGRAGSVPVADGAFGPVTTYVHKGQGPNLPRQDAAHCHQAIPAPDGKSFCVVDLGLDEVVTYPAGTVYATAPRGAGPRHMLFHPNGKLAFILFELGNRLASYRWCAADGFTLLDNVPTLPVPNEQTGRGPDGDLAAALRLTPDGRRLVVSNRGENSLVSYDFDAETGRLTFKARTLLDGSWPRDFVFVAPNRALVAMERSGDVRVLDYDAETGCFREINALRGLFRPVALTPAP